MNYTELKEYFTKFYLGNISKIELAFVIGLWQEAGSRIE